MRSPWSTRPPRSTARGRSPNGGQRQLQTLVRWRELTDTPELLDSLELFRFGLSRVIQIPALLKI